MISSHTWRNGRPAFSLVEAAVVLCAVAVVAMVAAPQVSVGGQVSYDAKLRHELEALRRAVTLYAAQHGRTAPGHPDGIAANAPSLDALREQLTSWTDRTGAAAAGPDANHRLGPYLSRIPTNPLNSLDTVRFLGPARRGMGEATGDHGWIYQPSTLSVAADATGRDSRGVRYIDY